MPRTCTICKHPEREAINGALVAGEPFRNIARRFAASAAAVYRHQKDHLPASLVQAKQAQDIVQSDNLLDRLLALSQETAAILREARAAKNDELALKAIGRAEKQIELQARLLGEICEKQTVVNVQVIAPVILQALEPYPEARLAVARRLVELEGSDERVE